ncbi:cytosolic Fe-S cluster assembly factor narfl [Parasteatoda tepidariorum]|uniref:cytosolic Fe-S cluster assembly factor narfl n=1 Tax=Parasteatoda tepidariorum TaxID=114398 RepID=UPI00077FDAD9|nr:cytosolic Fe-S cluster assembly factor narfl [Parasteatoda tepidariorum]
MFSGALQLTDLNDFITPSQECVKPIQMVKKGGKASSVVISDDGDFFETKENDVQEKLEKAKITLNDCLACSGCITSAESVLITEQSQEEFFKILEQNKLFEEAKDYDKVKTIVVSIAPQSRVSIAAKYKLDVKTAGEKLTTFFHNLGAKYVFDTTLARDFSLIETQKEFLNRYKLKDSGGVLPMLSSACPGWVCYAEKAHGEYILPYISLVKSPQQVMGSLIKNYLANKIHVKPNQIYHMSIMPCFDKKLEASRNDFFNEIYNTRDVDCVITPVEVEAMLETTKVNLNELLADNIDQINSENPFESGGLYTHPGSTSGGYCEHIFINAVKELFGESVSHLEFKVLRNQDLKEVVYEKDGKTLLRFAIANGFRNIQNIVQKLKRGKSPYHFVEIMACPSGCINGGAQIQATGEETKKDLVVRMEQLYHSLSSISPLDERNRLIPYLYKEWLEEDNPEKVKQMLYTQYHSVSKMNNALFIKW